MKTLPSSSSQLPSSTESENDDGDMLPPTGDATVVTFVRILSPDGRQSSVSCPRSFISRSRLVPGGTSSVVGVWSPNEAMFLPRETQEFLQLFVSCLRTVVNHPCLVPGDSSVVRIWSPEEHHQLLASGPRRTRYFAALSKNNFFQAAKVVK